MGSGEHGGRLNRRHFLAGGAATIIALLSAGCGTSAANQLGGTISPTHDARISPAARPSPAAPLPSAVPLAAVASVDIWGSILAQIGGRRITTRSIIVNPALDPHDYEPTAADARLLADAHYVVVNGAGYDPWATKLLAANPVAGRAVLNIGDLVGKRPGDNPHLWYQPNFVVQATKQMTTDLARLSPANAAVMHQQGQRYLNVTLKPYRDLIASIRQRFAGTPVGASESIFVYLATALGLNLITPPGYLQAINDGIEPAPRDKATADQQIAEQQIKVYVYNSQNATPDTDAQRDQAKAQGIPVVTITETLTPATATFQDWQIRQLQALHDALASATA